MTFNKRKFNIVVVFTLLLICVVVVFSAVELSAITTDIPTQTDAEGGDEDGDLPPNGADGEIENLGMKKLKSPFKNGFEALNYALSMLKYDNKISVDSSIIGEDQTTGVGGEQLLNKEIYNIGGKSYIKIVANGNKIPFGQGETYTQYLYLTASNIIHKKEGANIVSGTISDYLAKNGVLPCDIPYVLNQHTVKITDQTDSLKDYYQYKLVLSSGAWKDYLKGIAYTGGSGSNPSMKSITLTVKIDKTYGCFKSIKAEENYLINRGSFTADTKASITMIFDFKNSYTTRVNEIKGKLGI